MIVYVVITLKKGKVVDCEVLDQMPKWDFKAMGQVVRVANVNGGDSIELKLLPASV